MSHNYGCQFTVIGAGPYGMAAASHLSAAGIDVRIFGKPMDFWKNHMPEGMLLRSPWSGSNISDPRKSLTLDCFEQALSLRLERHMPVSDFVRYGQWFQQQELPHLDQRSISTVERGAEGYKITLNDGESFYSRNVMVATGIGSFAHRPAPFDTLPMELASHSSDPVNRDLARFAGKRVAVIGAGQSAIESAALLSEGGSEVEVVARQPDLRWLNTRPFLEWVMESKLYPFKAPGKIGPIGLNWLLENPSLFTLASRKMQDKMTYRAIRPAASSWLKPRTEKVTMTTGRRVASAEERNGQIHLKLDDGGQRSFDHVLLGTGYKIDVARYAFLAADLMRQVRTVNGYPILNRGFESTHPGLYFVGATAAYSFGPFLRFVAGTGFAAATLSRYVVQTQPKNIGRKYDSQPVAAR